MSKIILFYTEKATVCLCYNLFVFEMSEKFAIEVAYLEKKTVFIEKTYIKIFILSCHFLSKIFQFLFSSSNILFKRDSWNILHLAFCILKQCIFQNLKLYIFFLCITQFSSYISNERTWFDNQLFILGF